MLGGDTESLDIRLEKVIFRFVIFKSHLGYLVGPNIESTSDTNIKLGLVLVLGERLG